MGLNLQELQKVVKKVVKEEKNTNHFREEILRVLGPTVLVSRGLESMAKSANDRLDIVEAKGQHVESIRPSLLLKFIDSESHEVRKLVARLLPESFLKLLMKDRSHEVRYAVARRASHSLIREMIDQSPKDDYLKEIKKLKSLNESGLPTPDVDDEPFDMYGKEPLSKAYENVKDQELTDTWYDTAALSIFNTYGRNVEEQWEEDTVHRYVDSLASMNVDVDRDKLLKKVYDLLEDRNDAVVKESSLKDLAMKLKQDDLEFMPIISENTDPVEEMLASKTSNDFYISRFEEIFSVEHEVFNNPSHLRGICEGEELVFCPARATIPNNFMRSLDECAFDSYVKSWNFKKNDSPYRLEWVQDQQKDNIVNFYLELK